MSDVFISYSRKNDAFARRLIDQLTLANKDPWVDWEGIPLTSPNWWSEIKAGIEGADSFIFILSPDSMASVVCNLELDYAIELRKRIVPVVYQEVISREAFASIADYQPDAAMEERLAGKDPLQIARDNWQRLSHINWVFFRDSDDFDAAFRTLVTTVETDLPYVKAHTRYLTRALEWQREGRRADLLLFGAEIDAAEGWLVKAEGYTAQTGGKVDVVNPLPEAVQRDYVVASRRAQRRLLLLAGSGVLVAALSLVFAVGALLAGAIIVANAQAQEEMASVFADAALKVSQDAGNAARIRMDNLVRRYPNEANVYLFRGVISASLEQYEAAIADYTHAVELGVNYTEAYYNRGNAYRNLGQYEEAIADYSRAIELGSALPYNNRGLAYAGMRQYEEAIADYTHAIELDANFADAYINRGNAYEKLGQYEEAIADHNRAIELDGNLAPAYISRGNAYAGLGQYEAAIADYSRAIELDANDVGIYNNRGVAYADLGQYETAVADYTRAIELDANDAIAYNNRGNAYRNLEQYEAAIADLTRSRIAFITA